MSLVQPVQPQKNNNVFTIYELATGQITCVMETRDTEPPSMPTIGYVEGSYQGLTHKVVDGVAVEKESVDVEFDVTTGPPGTICTLSGLPNPITLQVDGVDTYEITDGTLEINMTTIGGYRVDVSDFRYLHRTWELSCV